MRDHRPCDLTGDVAVISGCGSEAGIGFACAGILAQLGARVALTATTDAYAADLYTSLGAQSRDTVQMAFGASFDEDRAAIAATLNAVLDESLRSWVMNRKTIAGVYADVDNAIRLIYEYPPGRA